MIECFVRGRISPRAVGSLALLVVLTGCGGQAEKGAGGTPALLSSEPTPTCNVVSSGELDFVTGAPSSAEALPSQTETEVIDEFVAAEGLELGTGHLRQAASTQWHWVTSDAQLAATFQLGQVEPGQWVVLRYSICEVPN